MSTTVSFFAIRHILTGNFIPRPLGRDGRGGTHLEPVEPKGTKETRPRFFETERSAKIFLTSWLKGKVVVEADYDDGYDFYSTTVVPVPSRRAKDMEIVPYTVELYT